MRIVDLIEQKRDGRAIAAEDLRALVRAITDDSVPRYQTAAFLMAVYFRGMNPDELVAWTEGMLHSGDVLDLATIPRERVRVDKHSTGGVGDKVSLVLAPWIAACGPCVPMISGRGLGHTGGTLDKLESLTGFDVALDAERFETCVREVGFAISGQTAEIAPADGRVYALRDVTGTVPSIPLIAASIMSKKLAEGLDALVLDVKVGSGAFMRTEADARTLADTMIAIGEGMGCRTRAILSAMDAPLGRAVGNANEVAEAIAALRGEGPDDLMRVTRALAEEMLDLAGVDDAVARLDDALSSGAALAKFREAVEAQGGDPRMVDDPTLLPSAPQVDVLQAEGEGFVAAFDCAEVGRACGVLGGGRARAEDTIDHGVGFEMLVGLGDPVVAGQPLVRITGREATRIEAAKARLRAAISIGAERPTAKPLVIDVLTASA